MKTCIAFAAIACTFGLGCGGHPTKTTPTGAPPPSGKSRIDCPLEPALTALARTHFAAATGELGVSCVAVFRDGPHWLLDGWHDPGNADGIAFVQAYVDATTGVARWTSGVGEFDFPSGAIDRITSDAWTAVDFDADGNDELLHLSGTMAQGYEMETLEVLAISDIALEIAGTVNYGEDNSAADDDPDQSVSCHSDWKLVAGPDGTKRIELTVTSDGAIAGSCLAAGTHVLAWNRTALVEVQ
jgi:hypothetical protein